MGWQELALIIVLVIIFVRPKDIPGLMKKVGYFAGQAKGYMNSVTEEIDRADHNIKVLEREQNEKKAQ